MDDFQPEAQVVYENSYLQKPEEYGDVRPLQTSSVCHLSAGLGKEGCICGPKMTGEVSGPARLAWLGVGV